MATFHVLKITSQAAKDKILSGMTYYQAIYDFTEGPWEYPFLDSLDTSRTSSYKPTSHPPDNALEVHDITLECFRSAHNFP